jgi:hypothetical protein
MMMNRLRWLGHIESMDNKGQMKNVYTKKIEGTTPRGRTKTKIGRQFGKRI